MYKYICKIYLKNQSELEDYIHELCNQKEHPTLEDVRFDFQWGTEVIKTLPQDL